MTDGGNSMTFLKRIAGAAALGSSLLLVSGLISSPAQAGYVVTLQEVGGDVVATGSGPIDLIGLIHINSVGAFPGGMLPSLGYITTGPVSGGGSTDVYSGFTGPTNFGSGGGASANSGNGISVGIA